MWVKLTLDGGQARLFRARNIASVYEELDGNGVIRVFIVDDTYEAPLNRRTHMVRETIDEVLARLNAQA